MDVFKFVRLATSWSVALSLLISLIGGPPPVARAGEISNITVTVANKATSASTSHTITFKISSKIPKDTGRIHLDLYGPAGDFNYPYNSATIDSTGTTPNSFEIAQRNWQGILLKANAEIAAATTVTVKLNSVTNPASGGYYFYKINTTDNYVDLDGSNAYGSLYHSPYFEVGTNTNLKGKITDSSSVAVPFAYVGLNTSNYSKYYNTYTDKNGEYGFSLPEGSYTFRLNGPPIYGTGKSYFNPKDSTVSIASSGVVTKDASFLAVSKTIKGRITKNAATGSPVTDATVNANRQDGGSGYVSVSTDSNGEYSFQVTGGSWSIYFYARSYPADWTYSKGSETITFTDDSTTETQTKNYIVTQLTATVKGKLVKPNGDPVAQYGANLNFQGTDNLYGYASLNSTDGTFSAKLAPGTYSVTGWSSDNTYSFPSVAKFTVGENETKDLGTIKLTEKTDTISGTVKDDSGNPVNGAYVSAWRNTPSYEYGSSTSDTEGKYTIKVTPGTWEVSSYPNWNSGYLNNTKSQSVIVESGKAAIVNFTFRKSTATIDCRLTDPDSNTLTGVSSWAGASDNSQSWANTGTSVTDGVCNPAIKVPPGTWDVSISLYHQDYSSPDPQKVTIAKDETKSLTFKAVKNDAELSGTVYDEAGNKITGRYINVWATKGKYGSWQSGNFDQSAGTYKMKLAEGTWNFGYWVSSQDGYMAGAGNSNDVEITLGAKEKKTYDITLRKASSTITGTAKKSNGDTIQWAWITADTKDPNEKTTQTYSYSNGGSSNSDGKYTIKVPPGTYFIGASYAYSSSGLINPQRQKIEIAADETKTVDLVFREADGTLTCTVKLDGNPTDAYITAYSESGGYSEGNASNEGNCELKVSKGDRWHVRAIKTAGKEVYKAAEVIVDLREATTGLANLELKKQSFTLPTTTSVTFDPTKQQTVTVDDGTTVTLPANSIATSGTSTMTVTPDANLPTEDDAKPLAYGYDLAVVNDGAEITTFKTEVTVEVKYQDPWLTDNAITDENEIKLAYYDKQSSTWRELDSCTVNEKENTITCQTNHFTKFAVVAATDTTPPAAPTDSKATAGDASAALEWKNPSDGDFSSVTIYRSTASGTLGEKIKTGETGTSYADSGLTNGTTYFYTVRAVDKSGNESSNTAQLSAQPKSGLAKAVAKGKVLPKTGRSAEAMRAKAVPIAAGLMSLLVFGGTLLVLRRRD